MSSKIFKLTKNSVFSKYFISASMDKKWRKLDLHINSTLINLTYDYNNYAESSNHFGLPINRTNLLKTFDLNAFFSI